VRYAVPYAFYLILSFNATASGTVTTLNIVYRLYTIFGIKQSLVPLLRFYNSYCFGRGSVHSVTKC